MTKSTRDYRGNLRPVQVGDLISYCIYQGTRCFVKVKVLALEKIDNITLAEIEVAHPYTYSSRGSHHIYPTQRYINANVTPTYQAYRKYWFKPLSDTAIYEEIPPRNLSNDPIDLKRGSIPAPPLALTKLSEAIRIIKERRKSKSTRPMKNRIKLEKYFTTTDDQIGESESKSKMDSESGSENNSDNESKSECDSENNSDNESESGMSIDDPPSPAPIPPPTQPTTLIYDMHKPHPIPLSAIQETPTKPKNWHFPENAVGITIANTHLKRIYVLETEWKQPGTCYDGKNCARTHNRVFKKLPCAGSGNGQPAGLPYRFCDIDSYTRAYSFTSTKYNTARFRLCTQCINPDFAYNAKRYVEYCPICLTTTTHQLLCGSCAPAVTLRNNESGAYLKNYITNLKKIIHDLHLEVSPQTTIGRSRIDILFTGSYKNIQFNIALEYDELEHTNYDPQKELSRMLALLKALSSKKLLFIRFNPKLVVGEESMKRIITLRQWVFWWLKNIHDLKHILILYLFYSHNNRRICFNGYNGMFLLQHPPKPRNRDGWDYAFVPEEQNYLIKTCGVSQFQDITEAAKASQHDKKARLKYLKIK